MTFSLRKPLDMINTVSQVPDHEEGLFGRRKSKGTIKRSLEKCMEKHIENSFHGQTQK